MILTFIERWKINCEAARNTIGNSVWFIVGLYSLLMTDVTDIMMSAVDRAQTLKTHGFEYCLVNICRSGLPAACTCSGSGDNKAFCVPSALRTSWLTVPLCDDLQSQSVVVFPGSTLAAHSRSVAPTNGSQRPRSHGLGLQYPSPHPREAFAGSLR